ncbi:MAG: site-specific DNA-methyltransferase, partial [Clostridia bacterium]|nr:site-specific DNA-methyltransferase [Clostridia bacterium]
RDWDTTENLYIEGDNLDVLKLLQESYLGKVKMIYIDPPYNTGNDFVYRDNFTVGREEYEEEAGVYNEEGDRLFRNTETNGRFHSDWCSMMYPRLVLARNVMSQDGVIFISINDNEQENLKKLCDEVFGASNYLTCITRATGTPTGGGFDGFVNELDYILVYAKRRDTVKIQGLNFSENDAKIYNMEDSQGQYLIRPLRRTGGEDRREDRPSMYFSIKAPDGSDVFPLGPSGYESRWICGRATYQELVDNNLIQWKKTNKGWQVYQKFYLENRTKQPGNLWVGLEGNKKATRSIRDLFDGEKVFDFPKPLGVISKITDLSTRGEDIILDFFSGSATTAHAVMQLNAEDGGRRKFIMVQLPEVCAEGTEAAKAGYANICEIGKERIRRAGKKIKEENKNKEGIEDLDIGFRVLKLADTNMNDVYYAAGDYTQDLISMMESNIKPDRTDIDLLYGCLLDWGLPLSMPHTREVIDGAAVHTYNNGDLIACFAEKVSESVVREIAGRQPLRAVFRDSSFASSPGKINVTEIFKLLAPGTAVRVI